VTIRRLFTAAALVIVSSASMFAQASNPLVGTWKLNAAKSKGSTFKSGTTKVEAAGEGVKFTVDLVAEDGTASHWSFTANYDGKDVKVTGASPYGDTAALSRVDARTTRIVSKRAGKVVMTQTIAVSEDGKTRTTTGKGTDAKGQPVDVMSFYERQ
jgi:hypothetical protein